MLESSVHRYLDNSRIDVGGREVLLSLRRPVRGVICVQAPARVTLSTAPAPQLSARRLSGDDLEIMAIVAEICLRHQASELTATHIDGDLEISSQHISLSAQSRDVPITVSRPSARPPLRQLKVTPTTVWLTEANGYMGSFDIVSNLSWRVEY